MGRQFRRSREPQIGETWSWLRDGAGRVSVKIERIEGDGWERRAVGTNAYGRDLKVRVEALAKGMRASRLELDVHGVAPVRLTDAERRRQREEKAVPTASDHLKTEPPRGLARVSDRQRRAVALHASGWSTDRVARKYGIKPKTLNNWMQRVRDADEDASNARET